MNELIERLVEQCYEHDQSWTGVGQRIFNKEKFARLIAAECAELCADIDGGENMFSRAIRKQFGVEE